MLFFHRRKIDSTVIDKKNQEAEKAKTSVLKQIHQTSKKVDKLNSLLEANGVTLQILKIMGGGRGH